MQLTQLGHSALLVDVAGRRILLDPGNFSTAWHGLTDLDAVLVTHQHPDHVDAVNLRPLLAANPGVQFYAEPSVAEVTGLPSQPLHSESGIDLGAVRVSAVGGLHAIIHRDIPQIGNIGLVITAEGEPTLFHPGDSLAAVPSGVDVIAIPAYGPWAAMKETIDFARAVAAPQGFLIHDGLLSERGWRLTFDRMNEMTPTAVADHRDQSPWTPTA